MKTTTGVLFHPDGRIERHECPANLLGYQRAVAMDDQCYIEKITLDDEHDLIIDEEGKLKEQPLNPAATRLCNMLGRLLPGDFVVGRAFLVRCTPSGDWESLPEETIELLLQGQAVPA